MTTGRDVERGTRRRRGDNEEERGGKINITSYNNIISYNNKCLDNTIQLILHHIIISVYTKNFSGIDILSRDDQRLLRSDLLSFLIRCRII